MAKKKKKKRGRPAGKAISRQEISTMFSMFSNQSSIGDIAREVGVSQTTVRRYRDREGWKKRRESIVKRAESKENARLATDQSRHTTLARAMQAAGAKRILTLTDDDISARDAKDFIKDGILLEREIKGESNQAVIQITIKLPAGLENV
jgi:AcrR family transcriptional regulator